MGYRSVFGLDVHARSVTASALDTATGEIRTRRFPCEPAEIASWILSFPGPSKAVYESGVTGFHLCRELRALGVDCAIGAVSKMFRPAADKGKKNDRSDSRFLARMLAANNIVEVYVPDEECEGMRNLYRAYVDAAGRLKAATNRLAHFLIRHGHVWNERTPKGALRKAWGSQAYGAWLNSIELACPADRDAFEHYLLDAQAADASAKALERLIARHAQNPRYKPVVDALCSIKGLETVAAFAFAVEVDDFARFPTPDRFASFLGLAASEYSSGEKKASGGITKAGNTHLRRLATECAWSYARCGTGRKQPKKGRAVSPAVAEEAHRASLRLKRRRGDLVAAGKNPCVANTAVARELACWIWRIATMVQAEASEEAPGKAG